MPPCVDPVSGAAVTIVGASYIPHPWASDDCPSTLTTQSKSPPTPGTVSHVISEELFVTSHFAAAYCNPFGPNVMPCRKGMPVMGETLSGLSRGLGPKLEPFK